MYENNFWYLFDVKKLTLLNYDNLKKYYVNLKGFLKLYNFNFEKLLSMDATMTSIVNNILYAIDAFGTI